MSVSHRPIFDTEKVEKLYSEKDEVAIKYVCTTALDGGMRAVDVFYRETPHPEFGNRYFGLYRDQSQIFITNADKVEDLEFDMVLVDEEWHYSQHRHDFYTIGNVSIDGGRAYFRMLGNIDTLRKTFKVKNGEFIEDSHL